MPVIRRSSRTVHRDSTAVWRTQSDSALPEPLLLDIGVLSVAGEIDRMGFHEISTLSVDSEINLIEIPSLIEFGGILM